MRRESPTRKRSIELLKKKEREKKRTEKRRKRPPGRRRSWLTESVSKMKKTKERGKDRSGSTNKKKRD